MLFTAIDFETANFARSSACAVGLSIAENGRIVDSVYHLIRPEPFFFDPYNTYIHGIREEDVADSPTFSQLWPDLYKAIKGPLVAHNAAFDMSVLRHTLNTSRVCCPKIDYFCTLVISRLTWPHYSSHALNYLAEELSIDFNHHHAAEDARACALIAQAACRSQSVESLYDLPDRCNLRIGSLSPTSYVSCGKAKNRPPARSGYKLR